jgi:hypothetical protein
LPFCNNQPRSKPLFISRPVPFRATVPTRSYLDEWGRWYEGMPTEEYGRVQLHRSIMSDDDFSRYVIGGLDEWTSLHLDAPAVLNRKQQFNQFVESLSARQKSAFDRYRDARQAAVLNLVLGRSKGTKAKAANVSTRKQASIAAAEVSFLRAVSREPAKRAQFSGPIKAYLDNPARAYEENQFDAKLVRRWMLQRVIEMGWTVKRFGAFDRGINW